MSKASFVVVPVANDSAKANLDRTVFDRDVGYWSTPAGANGDAVQVGDQIWFVGGKNEQAATENAVKLIGNITQVITQDDQLEVFEAMSSVWDGDWSDRRIVVFRVIPVLAKDELTYDEVCDLFDYKGLPNGSIRVKMDA